MLITCTNTEYHARPELSSSQLAAFIADPVDFHHTYVAGDWPKPEPSLSMEFGTAVHELIETGQPPVVRRIPAEVLTSNGQKRGKAWDAWKVEQPAGALLLKPDEIDWREPLWQHLQANDYTRRWCALDDREVSFAWEHPGTGIGCRCRLDVVDHQMGLIVDWKTTPDIGPAPFARSCVNFRYHVRLAFYRYGWQVAFGEDLRLVAVAIKNRRSWTVKPYQLADDWWTQGYHDMQAAMQELAEIDVADYLNQGPVVLDRPRWHEPEYEGAT